MEIDWSLGQRYGVRFIVHLGDFSRDPAIVLFQMGGVRLVLA